MANEFKVKNGLIVIGDLTTSGTITINGALAATQSWVTSQAYLTSASLSGYATQSYVTSALAALVDAAPAALDTLNELAAALGDDANFSTTITNSIASKQAQLNGTGLVRMSGTSVSYDNTTYLVSNFGNIEGEHSYGYPSSDGWYKIAEVVFNGSCQSYNLWGEYRDTGYFDNSHYRIHITARAECDFPTNNESHAINVNMYGSSTNETYFNNNVRVVLTSSSSNYRKYELQYYRATWDTGSWNLQTLGWTTYTTSQTAGTPTGTARVYYISKFVADNIYAANKISIGTTYSGFAANIAGTTYVIGASVWVNDGYGISNASSGGTGFFPYSDGTLVFNSVNSEKMRIAPSGNVGIGTNSPGYKLEVEGSIGVKRIGVAATSTLDMEGNFNFNANSGYSHVFKQAGSEVVRIQPSGNLGIGTASPGAKLTVYSDTTTDGIVIDVLSRPRITLRDRGNSDTIIGTGDYGLDDFFIDTYSGNALAIKGSTRNVGIGTTSPGNILTVNGDTRLVTGTTQGLFAYDAPSGGAFIWSLTRYTDTNANDLNVNTRSGFGIRTGVESLTNSGHQFYVTSGGNVGIGTTAPTHRLTVAGGNVLMFPSDNTRQLSFFSDSYGITASSGLELITGDYIRFRQGSTELARLTTTGLGIGTTSPSSALEVIGTIRNKNASANSNYSQLSTTEATLTLSTYSINTGSYPANIIFSPASTEAMRINTAGKVSIGTTDTNSDKSDFTVYTGGTTTLALAGNLLRVGDTDVNWGVALRSNGVLETYGQNLYLGSAAGNHPVTINPNGTNSVSFYQTESYINTYTRINYNWGGGPYGTEAFTIRGTYPSIGLRSTQHDSKWLIHHASELQFYYGASADSNVWSNVFSITTNGNLYMAWAGGYISDLLNAKQNASTAITTSNIGSQSVSYANSAGSATTAGALSSMNISQFTNNSGYITGYTETDTLASVTGRGATTSTPITVTGTEGREVAVYIPSSYTTDDLVSGHEYGWYSDHWRLGMTRSGGAAGADFVVQWNASRRLSLTSSGNLTATGTITATGGNSSQWNTAYGWGNHASAGYLTSYSETDTLNSVTSRGASTSNAITVGATTINGVWQTNISTSGGWSKLSFTASNAWGDGTTYGTLGASGGNEPGVMVYNMHATWVGSGQGAGIRMGRSGGVAGGSWYQVATMDSDEFMIAKNGQWSNGGIKITSGGELQHGNSGNKYWHAGNDGSGSGLDADLLDGQNSTEFLRLLSGGAEASLDSYTDNGFRSVSFPGHSQHLLSWNAGGSTGTVQQLFHYGTPNNGWRIRNKTDNTSWSDWGYVVMASSNQGLISGTIATQSWVGSQSYATTSYVTTQINNLINGAPGALDTLDELAAALGDDSNFATTVTNSIATKLPLAGGTMSGTISFVNNLGTALQGTIGDNDFWRIHANSTSSNAGYLEIATSDDGTEPIYVRQYTGVFSNLTRTATLLDGAGNTAFPGNLNIGGFLTESSSIKLKENVETSEGNLEKVVNLRPVTYNKIGSQTTELGLIAEEVAEVYPEFVQYDENGEPVGVNYSRLTAALIGAVKELTNQVQELNKKING